MRTVYQASRDDDSAPVGDCFRACIASLIDHDLTEVPHFYQGLRPGEPVPSYVEDWMRRWFAAKGLYLVGFPFQGDPPSAIIRAVCRYHPGQAFILTGQSHKGVDHAVIIKDGAIWHDPSGSHFGLHGPQANGFYMVYTLALRTVESE